MGSFWKSIATVAVKIALFAVNHESELQKIVEEVIALSKEAKKND
jgi:hypothetical protein